jgi:hypothetical protein
MSDYFRKVSLLLIFAPLTLDPEEDHLGAAQPRRRECGTIRKRLVLEFCCTKFCFVTLHFPTSAAMGSAETRRSQYGFAEFVRDNPVSRRAG